MKENFLHFVSDSPSMLSLNGKNIGNIDNKTCFGLDVITKTNHIYVTYEPISNKNQALPYTVLIDTQSEPKTENEYIRVVPFPNNNYDIIMKPFYYYQISESNVLFNGTVSKYFVSITSDTSCKVIIYSGVTIVFSINIVALTAVSVEEHKGIIVIKGVVDESTYYLLAINTEDFSIIHNDIVHSIENNSDEISAYKELGTLCNHAQVCNIDFNTKTKNSYYVFASDTPNTNINSALIPMAFLECIQIQDEKTAKLFLSNNYQNSNISQFCNYFGNFTDIQLNRHELILHKLNYSIKSDKWHNYNFLIENNKIYEIEEIF